MGILDKSDTPRDFRSNPEHQAEPGLFEGLTKNRRFGLRGSRGAAGYTRIKLISTRAYCGVRKKDWRDSAHALSAA